MKGLLFDTLHQGIGDILDLRSAQHALTAANLANADTPQYRARVIPFDRILKEVVDRSEHTEMKRSDARHYAGLHGDADRPSVEEIEPPAWSANGNSVQLERETVRLTENALMYEALSGGLSRRMAMMRFAAADGKG